MTSAKYKPLIVALYALSIPIKSVPSSENISLIWVIAVSWKEVYAIILLSVWVFVTKSVHTLIGSTRLNIYESSAFDKIALPIASSPIIKGRVSKSKWTFGNVK